MYRTGSVRHQAVTKGQVLKLQDYKICRQRSVATKVIRLSSQLVSGGLLCPHSVLPLPLPLPLPLSLSGRAGARVWSSPWLACSPEDAATLIMGAWCHSLLLFMIIEALLEDILTASLTWRWRHEEKFLKGFMIKICFTPPCWRRQCFQSGLSSFSLRRSSWCSRPLVKAFRHVSPS